MPRPSMLIFPPFALGIALYDCRSVTWMVWATTGVLLWTLTEYWTHPTLLHVFFWHGTHERHHDQPAEYVIFSWWHTPLIFANFYIVLPLPIFTGFVTGYIWFLLMHIGCITSTCASGLGCTDTRSGTTGIIS